MKIEFLKSQLSLTGGSGVNDVFFDDPSKVLKGQQKTYPYILWDWNTFRPVTQWQNTSQVKETIKGFKAFIFGYYDRDAIDQDVTMEEKWDELRAFFRAYLTVLNANSYIKVDNLNTMPNELFNFGLSLDSEIAVSFDVDLTLFCNA